MVGGGGAGMAGGGTQASGGATIGTRSRPSRGLVHFSAKRPFFAVGRKSENMDLSPLAVPQSHFRGDRRPFPRGSLLRRENQGQSP